MCITTLFMTCLWRHTQTVLHFFILSNTYMNLSQLLHQELHLHVGAGTSLLLNLLWLQPQQAAGPQPCSAHTESLQPSELLFHFHIIVKASGVFFSFPSLLFLSPQCMPCRV